MRENASESHPADRNQNSTPEGADLKPAPSITRGTFSRNFVRFTIALAYCLGFAVGPAGAVGVVGAGDEAPLADGVNWTFIFCLRSAATFS